MKNHFLPVLCRAGFVLGAIATLTVAPLRAADPASDDAFPRYDSYIKISGQAASISGDKSAFQSRTQQIGDGGAGIEDLHLSKDYGKNTTVDIDGRALVGAEDYLGQVKVSKNEVGSVEMGYKRFRTFYDGVGGFFPLSNQWMPLANEDLHIDRSKFWVTANLTLPNAPVFTLRYTNELRSGRKDSTIWGSSDYTGLPFTVAPNPVSPVRKGAPSFINIGERHQRLDLTMKHTVGKTELVVTLFGDETKNLDTRYVTNFPGEVIPWSIASLASAAQPAAKAALAPTNWNNQVAIAQSDGMATKSSGLLLETDTAISSQLSLKVSGIYEMVNNDITGDRPLVTSTPTSTGVVLVTTNNNQNLVGGAHIKEATGSIALDYHPMATLAVKLGLRAGNEYVRGTSSYNALAASGTPAVTVASTPRFSYGRLHQNSQTPVLDVRYTGIKDLALYFSGSKRNVNGVDGNSSAFNPLTAASGTVAYNNVGEDHGDYTLGANWKQSAMLSLRAELFTKAHKDDYTGYGVTVGDYYLLDSQVDGYKLTAIVKPSPMVGFTTRFVSQRSKMKVTGFLPTYPAFDSLNGKNYSFSETIDYVPSKLCYVQLNGTVVYNVISTIYPRAGITVATATNNAYDTNRVLQNSDNNYVTGSFLTGFVVDKATDAQIQVNLYHATNGNPILAPLTQPFGVSVKDVSYTVGVKHKMSDKWIGIAKVGYFESTNDTLGGFANFHGPLAFVSVEHAF
jgi:hypothetical protein